MGEEGAGEVRLGCLNTNHHYDPAPIQHYNAPPPPMLPQDSIPQGSQQYSYTHLYFRSVFLALLLNLIFVFIIKHHFNLFDNPYSSTCIEY